MKRRSFQAFIVVMVMVLLVAACGESGNDKDHDRADGKNSDFPLIGKLILGVVTGSSIDLAAVHADDIDYSGTSYEDGRLCWGDSVNNLPDLDMSYDVKHSGDDWPSKVSINCCISSTGEFYATAKGPASDVLSMISGNAHLAGIMNKDNPDVDEVQSTIDIRQNVLGEVLYNYYISQSYSLVSKGYAIGGAQTEEAFYNSTYRFYNGFTKPIFFLKAGLISGAPFGADYSKLNADQWCPQPDYDTTGTAKRSFDISYENALHSAVSAFAYNDNLNSSYIKAGSTVLAEQNDFASTFKLYLDYCPSTIELGTNTIWSSSRPYYTSATLADGVSVANVHEWNANNEMDPADSLDQNPAPWILEIKPGWTQLN